jgi:hypothetical protein
VETSLFETLAGLFVMVSLAAGCSDSRPTTMPTTPPSPSPSPQTDWNAVIGVYQLTFDASPSCDLPEESRHRTYTATIGPVGTPPTVTLTGAPFYTGGYCGAMNTFDARVRGNTLFFSDWGGDCGIVELLANSRFLTLWGSAEATVTDRITGLFNGYVSIAAGPPDGSDISKPTAICTAIDHRLVFERTN